MQRMGSIFAWTIAAVAFVLLLSQPLYTGNFAIGHDLFFHLCRIDAIAEGLQSGQFPVRIYGLQFYGYGIPVGIFYPDLFLYIPALLRLAGCTVFFSYNAFALLLNVLTLFLSWWAFGKLLNSWRMGVVAAMLYEASFYRLVDFYCRSSLGEMVAMTFLPLACVSVWLVLRKSPRYWPVVVLSGTAIVQSHIISGVFFVAAALVMAVLNVRHLREREIRWATGKAMFFLAALNIWFYVPLAWFMQYMAFYIQDSMLPLYARAFHWDGAVTLQFFQGWPMLALVAVAAFRMFFGGDSGERGAMFWSMLVLGLVSGCAMWSAFPWETLQALPVVGEKLSFMQFPYRLEEFTAICLSLAVAIGIGGRLLGDEGHRGFMLSERAWYQRHGCLLLVLCLLTVGLWNLHGLKSLRTEFVGLHDLPAWMPNDWVVDFSLQRARMGPEDQEQFVRQNDLFGVDYLYSDMGFKTIEEVREHFRSQEIQPPDVVTSFEKKGVHVRLSYRAEEETKVVLPMLYYPGYEAHRMEQGKGYRGKPEEWREGSPVEVSEAEGHRLQLALPPGAGQVDLRYEGLPFFRWVDWISLVAFLAFLGLAGREAFNRR